MTLAQLPPGNFGCAHTVHVAIHPTLASYAGFAESLRRRLPHIVLVRGERVHAMRTQVSWPYIHAALYSCHE